MYFLLLCCQSLSIIENNVLNNITIDYTSLSIVPRARGGCEGVRFFRVHSYVCSSCKSSAALINHVIAANK